MPHTAHRLHITSLRTARRLRQIVAILVKYGFSELLDAIGLRRRRPFREGVGSYHDMRLWRKLRFAVEDLGPTAIKIGQAASMRPDLIPAELALELKDLHEDVREVPFRLIREAVEQSYGRPLAEVFSCFDEKPVAAASLSQVHRAVLAGGSEVVAVKVRRPGIMEVILSDLDLMAYLAGLAHERVESLKAANLPELVDELRKSLLRELNFVNEAQNIAIFRENFADEPAVFAPRAHMAHTTEEVLVLDFVQGSRIDRLDLPPERRARLAELGVAAATRMMLEHGFFHADPHYGNLRITPDERICFLDWGMVGRLTPDMRSALLDYITALVQRDAKKVSRVALDMAVAVPPLLDFQKFQTDIMFVLERIHAPVGGQPNLGRFLLDLTTLCRDYGVHLRSDYVLMARALMSIEAAGRTMHPPFDVMGALRPIAARTLLRRASVLFSDKPVLGEAHESLEALVRTPSRLFRLLGVLECGDLQLKMKLIDFNLFTLTMRKAANRVSEAVVIASLVLGSAVIFTSDLGPHWQGMPVVGLLGFCLSGFLGVILLWQIAFNREK